MDGGLKTPGTTGYQRLRPLPLGSNEIDRKFGMFTSRVFFFIVMVSICWLYHPLPLLQDHVVLHAVVFTIFYSYILFWWGLSPTRVVDGRVWVPRVRSVHFQVAGVC